MSRDNEQRPCPECKSLNTTREMKNNYQRGNPGGGVVVFFKCHHCGKEFKPVEATNPTLELAVARAMVNSLDAEISRLTDHIDLMADEFKRIKALHSAPAPHSLEVSGLCDRAITNIKQRVPVIEQRDKVEAEVERLTLENKSLAAMNERHSDDSFKPDWAGYKQHQSERDELKAEVERLTSLSEKYRLEMIRCGKGWEAARAEGYAQGVDGVFPLILPAIQAYRSTIAACDDDGNGAELSDVLAAGYGDEDIANALKELGSLADHICAYIICDSRNRALAPAAPVTPAPARTYEDGMREAARIAESLERWSDGGETGYQVWAYSNNVTKSILAAAGNPPTVGEVAVAIKFGCHCELLDGEQPDGCVLDTNDIDDCIHAEPGMARESCEFWRECSKPISIKEAL